MSLLDVLVFLLIFSACEVVSGLPTPEEYDKINCSNGTFKCPPSGSCCKNDSEMCSKLSAACEPVFLQGEDEDYVCCNALFNNGSTRDGLIEVCTNRWRSGSGISRGYCEAKYFGEPQREPSSTVAATKPPPTVVPTQPQQEQITPSSAAHPGDPTGETTSTTAGSTPPPTVVPTQPQKEQPTLSSELSSDRKLGVGILIGIAICVAVAIVYKLLWGKRKCRQGICNFIGKCKACCCRPFCPPEVMSRTTSTSSLGTQEDEPDEPASAPSAQNDGAVVINIDSQKSKAETPEGVPENPTSETELIPVNLDRHSLAGAPNSQSGNTTATMSAGTACCPTCKGEGTVFIEIPSTSSPETPAEEPAIDPVPSPNLAISLVELAWPDYSSAETDNLLGEGPEPAEQTSLQ